MRAMYKGIPRRKRMTDMWQRVERLIGAENLGRLAEKKVAVVGLGSGGGFVAVSLAMSGVGQFVLVDSDELEAGNVTRHVCDLRYVGQNKAAAVADLIMNRNPEAQVETRAGLIEDHWDCLDDVDILVAAVDSEQVKFTINEQCLAKRLTASYAGVYERGEGGDHVIIRPFDGPCYACWSEATRDGVMVAMSPGGELDYGMIGEAGTLEAEPGLWVNVTKVAGIQTDLILNELQRGASAHEPMPANTLIVTNSYIGHFRGGGKRSAYRHLDRNRARPRLPGLRGTAQTRREQVDRGRRGQHFIGGSGGFRLDDRYRI